MSSPRPVPLFALLASGEGTNVSALLEFAAREKILGHFKVLICDQARAGAIERARAYELPVVVIEREKGESRESYERKLLMALRPFGVNWALLAGFMKILGPTFLKYFWDAERGHYRLVNIHPSLLPAYPGLNAYERAFNDGVSEAGVSVHLVTPGVDEGPILLQRSFKHEATDTLATFMARGKKIEHEIYPEAIALILADRYLEQL